MKIGIITFHRVLNYGAVLQTYALQRALEKIGYECVVVDYRKDEFEQEYRNLKFTSFSPKDIYHTLKCWMVRKKDMAFLDFISRNLNLTVACVTDEELKAATDDCDIILTGSDQVFNYITTDNDGHYYLDFVEGKKKCSYAASFGFNDFSKDHDLKVKEWLQDFDAISVREIEGKEYLTKLLHCDISLHCDPSFLLTKDEWMCLKGRKPDREYVLVYSVGKSKELIRCAEEVAKQNGLDIIYIKYTYEYCGKAKVLTDVSPEDFISIVYQARYVVTNLFHGVAFSMILEKDFYVCLQEKVKTNSRLMHLLSKYGLNGRIVTATDHLDEKTIDYEPIREAIQIERKVAEKYLIGLGGIEDAKCTD